MVTFIIICLVLFGYLVSFSLVPFSWLLLWTHRYSPRYIISDADYSSFGFLGDVLLGIFLGLPHFVFFAEPHKHILSTLTYLLLLLRHNTVRHRNTNRKCFSPYVDIVCVNSLQTTPSWKLGGEAGDLAVSYFRVLFSRGVMVLYVRGFFPPQRESNKKRRRRMWKSVFEFRAGVIFWGGFICWNARNFANMTYPDSQRSVSTGQEDPLSDFILVVHILKA